MDATTSLIQALRRTIPAPLAFREVRSRAWATTTFSGARHELTFRTTEGAASNFVASLDATALRLRGHLLADIALVSDERSDGAALLRLQALTVEGE
jgi:hypothetical protein